jgi:phage terminase small subunit
MTIGIREMAKQLTPKQEGFCQLVASGSNYSDAYRSAYNCAHTKDTTVNRNAAGLAHQDKITARLMVLKKQHQQRHNITVDTIKEGFLENIQHAKELDKPESVNSSLNGLMKLYGLGVEKHKHEISAGEELMLRFFGSLPDTTGLPSERDD